MKAIKTEIVINADIKTVWNILMDFDAYPQWNPFIKEISGNPAVGETIKARMDMGEGSRDMTFTPKVTTNMIHSHFAWLGNLWVKGIFDGAHHFELKQEGDKTRFLQYENFRGILSGILFAMVGKTTQKGFEAMNEALKRLAEERAGSM